MMLNTDAVASAVRQPFAVVIGEIRDVPAVTDIQVDCGRYLRHPNGGGLVETTAFVAPAVYVGPDARVQDHAIVTGNVSIRDHAVVAGYAVIADRCLITKHSYVGGNAVLRDRVWTRHRARIDGDAVLIGAITVEYTRHIDAGVFTGTLGIC